MCRITQRVSPVERREPQNHHYFERLTASSHSGGVAPKKSGRCPEGQQTFRTSGGHSREEESWTTRVETNALAVDRGNENVDELFDPMHPAVLRAINFVAAARKTQIPPSVRR
ncbi:MAG: putative PEP-binding protein [Blastocatellia bacterium]